MPAGVLQPSCMCFVFLCSGGFTYGSKFRNPAASALLLFHLLLLHYPCRCGGCERYKSDEAVRVVKQLSCLMIDCAFVHSGFCPVYSAIFLVFKIENRENRMWWTGYLCALFSLGYFLRYFPKYRIQWEYMVKEISFRENAGACSF